MKGYIGMIIVVLALTGCTAKKDADQKQSESSEESHKLSVVASFYPLAYMAERIGGEVVTVQNIIGGSDPHDYKLSPGDITAMHDADVVLLQGVSLEPWGEDMVGQLEIKDIAVVEVAEKLSLMKNEDEYGHEGEEHEDEHADEHEGEESKDEDHEDEQGHAHGEYDPHTWLDPVLAGQMVDVIADAMIAASPENAEVFGANAAELHEEFEQLNMKYVKGLENCAHTEVIISHDFLGYLAKRYNFTIHAIAGISTQDEPSAETLAQLKGEAAEGVTHILTEENAVKRFSETLANETGLTMLPIDPLAAPSVGERGFIDRANTNLVQLQKALGCHM